VEAEKASTDNAEKAPSDNAEKTSTDNADILDINAGENEVFEKFGWEDATATCQGCGMCTYICPTCHCFMFKDVLEKDEASRFRIWDSCMFPKFTLHASGHNPREEKYERYRQRVMHKYLYVKENFDAVACTGCGRCIRNCPAGVNIKTIVEEIMEVFP
jgi:ferredoxin